MQARTAKPVLVPTALSARVALWSLVYAAAFGALLWIYRTYGGIEAARTALARPASTVVETRCFKVVLPPGWAQYACDDDSLDAVIARHVHRVADRYKGHSLREIAQRLGRAENTVREWLKKPIKN